MKPINFGQAAALTSPLPLVLVCTEKEDGSWNTAPVSFTMYASVSPFMLAFAMAKPANTGANLRRTGKAVVVVPGDSLREASMAYGGLTGAKSDKLKEHPIPLKTWEESPIQIPEDTVVAYAVTLVDTVDSGDHYLYLCNIDAVAADETKTPLFAWNGYAKVAPAKEG